jgi:hypothetical protein
MKHRYDNFIAAGDLLEQFCSDSNVHRRISNALDDNFMATHQILVNQDLTRPIRSLKINAKELMKVLKESKKSWQDGIAVGSYKVFQQDVYLPHKPMAT